MENYEGSKFNGFLKIRKSSSFIDVLAKVIPVLVFFLLVSGSFQLFIFSKKHHVRFIDLLQSNLIIAFSSIFLMSCAIIIAIFTILLPLNVNAKVKYVSLFSGEQWFELVKSTNLKMLLFYLIVSLWPLLINYSIIIALISPVGVLMVHFTLLINEHKKRLIKEFIIISIVGVANVFIMLFSVGMLSILYKEILRGIPDSVAIASLCVFQFLIFLTVFIPYRGNQSPGFFLQCLVALCLSQIFFFSMPDQITSLSIRSSGLGLEQRCFYDIDLRNKKIPDEFITRIITPVATTKYSRINVVANPGRIFYLSKDHKDYSSEYRFIDDSLPEISCIAAAAVDPKTTH